MAASDKDGYHNGPTEGESTIKSKIYRGPRHLMANTYVYGVYEDKYPRKIKKCPQVTEFPNTNLIPTEYIRPSNIITFRPYPLLSNLFKRDHDSILLQVFQER